MNEASLLVGTDTTQIVSINMQEYSVQVQSFKTVAQQEPHDFRAIPLSLIHI